MMFNYNLLNNRIAQVCGSQQEFARRLGISFEELQEKLVSGAGLYTDDMKKGIDILSIPMNEADINFFNKGVLFKPFIYIFLQKI